MNPETPQAPEGRPFNPWLFFGTLTTPGILSLIVILNYSKDYGITALLTLLGTSTVCGFICGVHLAKTRRSSSTISKPLAAFGWGILCALASFGIGFGGCFLLGPTGIF